MSGPAARDKFKSSRKAATVVRRVLGKSGVWASKPPKEFTRGCRRTEVRDDAQAGHASGIDRHDSAYGSTGVGLNFQHTERRSWAGSRSDRRVLVYLYLCVLRRGCVLICFPQNASVNRFATAMQ